MTVIKVDIKDSWIDERYRAAIAGYKGLTTRPLLRLLFCVICIALHF